LEQLKIIENLKFSRIPVCFSEKEDFIIGILIVKDLIAVDVLGMTICDLYRHGKIKL
jgi:CBS domain containing-hemolysin-like protein